jgi:colicin import membrane protein
MAMTMATAGGPYRVPKRHGGTRAFALALAMHCVLFVFLWVGIRWNNDPTGVDAEIWDVTTQMAAPKMQEPEPEPEKEPEPPKAVTPPPPPPEVVKPLPKEPDIALQKKKEKEKKEAEDKQKLADLKKKLDDEKKRQADLDKKEKLEQEKAKKQAELKEKERLAKVRAAELQRIAGQAAAGSVGQAARSTAPRLDDGYKAALVTRIRSFLNYPGQEDIEAVYTITQLPSGEVLGVRRVKSSGVPAYDTAIESAIRNASPLPKRKDGTVEREITATFKLKEMRQ